MAVMSMAYEYGFDKGHARGYEEGFGDGYRKGYEQGWQDANAPAIDLLKQEVKKCMEEKERCETVTEVH